jgi:hypothetical protein
MVCGGSTSPLPLLFLSEEAVLAIAMLQIAMPQMPPQLSLFDRQAAALFHHMVPLTSSEVAMISHAPHLSCHQFTRNVKSYQMVLGHGSSLPHGCAFGPRRSEPHLKAAQPTSPSKLHVPFHPHFVCCATTQINTLLRSLRQWSLGP